MNISDSFTRRLRAYAKTACTDILAIDQFSSESLKYVTSCIQKHTASADLLIMTDGSHGDYASAYHVMKALKAVYQDVTAIVPGFAGGPATLFVAGADLLMVTARSRIGYVKPILPTVSDTDGHGWDAIYGLLEAARHAGDHLVGPHADAVLASLPKRINLSKAARDLDHIRLVVAYLSELMGGTSNFIRHEPGHLVCATDLPDTASIPKSVLRESFRLKQAPEELASMAEALFEPKPSLERAPSALFVAYETPTTHRSRSTQPVVA